MRFDQLNVHRGVTRRPGRNGAADTVVVQGTSDRVAPSTTESTQAIFDIFASERSSTLVWNGGRATIPNVDNSITGADFIDGGILQFAGSVDAFTRAVAHPVETTKGLVSTATCGMEVSVCFAMATAQGVVAGAGEAYAEYGADGAAGYVVASGIEVLFGLRGVGAISALDNITFASVPRLIDDVVTPRQLDNYVPNASFCSFSGETGVLMADGTIKPISEVEIGDLVIAFDPEAGERGEREVTHLWVHQDTLVDLQIGDSTVTTTEDHPFWNHTDTEWQRADQLDGGDYVLTVDGALLAVDGLNPASTHSGTAYNLTINDIHTYYVQVGNEQVLVHNTCPGQLSLFDADPFLAPGASRAQLHGGNWQTGSVGDAVSTQLGSNPVVSFSRQKTVLTGGNGAQVLIDSGGGYFRIRSGNGDYLMQGGSQVPANVPCSDRQGGAHSQGYPETSAKR